MSKLPAHILNHYEDPFHQGACQQPTHRADGQSDDCPDELVIELRIVGNQISEAWFDGEGCKISQAAASLLMEAIEGKSIEEIQRFSDADMLQLLNTTTELAPLDCGLMAVRLLRSAINSPIDPEFETNTFSGPDLGDEC